MEVIYSELMLWVLCGLLLFNVYHLYRAEQLGKATLDCLMTKNELLALTWIPLPWAQTLEEGQAFARGKRERCCRQNWPGPVRS